MPRVIKDAPLTTATARKALPAGTHWRALGEHAHIGYRKARKAGQVGGSWAWRFYRGAGQYWQDAIGSADDFLSADGERILNFDQAARKAREAIQKRLREHEAAKDGQPLTVADAVNAYIARREARGREGMKRDARSRLTRYVLGDPLAPTLLANLDKSALANWRERVAGSGLATATVMRVSSDLKAALNAAHRRSEKGLPPTFPLIVKDGLAVPSGERQPHGTPLARADQILSIGDVRRLVSASRDIDSEQNWSGDLARLIIVLAATGARFSQAAALKVGDVQVPERRIMVPVSSKGRGAKPVTHTPVAVTADVIDALLPVLIGRKAGEPLLERWRHRQVKGAEWVRERRGPWLSASEITRPWAEIVARAGLAKSLVPYCLRHSSIVRGLRANLPVRHVASLHDTSASMVERHYSAFIVSALDELAASVAVSVANELPEANVVPLSRSG